MAKYDNSYIEQLNNQLGELETRLLIARTYVAFYKDICHYSPEPGVLRLILGLPINKEEPEIPAAK